MIGNSSKTEYGKQTKDHTNFSAVFETQRKKRGNKFFKLKQEHTEKRKARIPLKMD